MERNQLVKCGCGRKFGILFLQKKYMWLMVKRLLCARNHIETRYIVLFVGARIQTSSGVKVGSLMRSGIRISIRVSRLLWQA